MITQADYVPKIQLTKKKLKFYFYYKEICNIFK